MWLLRLFSFGKGASFLSFRDGETFEGTTYIVEYEDNLFIFYLAVSPDARGKWYGSMILDYVKENGKGKNVNLDVEAVDNCADKKYMALSSNPQSFNPESFTRMWRHALSFRSLYGKAL